MFCACVAPGRRCLQGKSRSGHEGSDGEGELKNPKEAADMCGVKAYCTSRISWLFMFAELTNSRILGCFRYLPCSVLVFTPFFGPASPSSL